VLARRAGASAEATTLKAGRDPHPLEFGGVRIHLSHGAQIGDVFASDPDQELTAGIDVALLDLVEVLITWAAADVGAHGLKGYPMQVHDLLVLGVAVTTDLKGQVRFLSPRLRRPYAGPVECFG